MKLPVQDFATLVKTQASAVAAASQQLVDTSVGSVLRALLEANASVGLWVQWLILQVLAITRAATSNGVDLDSWIADFGLTRLPAAPAAGQVQLSRITAGLPVTVPVGAKVRTGTGQSDQLFLIAADTTSAFWNGAAGFTLPAGQLSLSVPVVADVAGSAGNVLAGAIVQMATAISGIDAVTNPAPMTGGVDAESDTALRKRFSLFLDSRTRATTDAVAFAIDSVRQGLSYTIASRMDSSGALRPGHFTVTLDDGTGSPAPAIMNAVSAAIDNVRAIGGTFSVRPPLLMPTDVSVVFTGGNATTIATVRAALIAYVSQLSIGASLFASKLTQIVHEADAAVQSVHSVLINGGTADVVPPIYGLVRPNNVQVSQ